MNNMFKGFKEDSARRAFTQQSSNYHSNEPLDSFGGISHIRSNSNQRSLPPQQPHMLLSQQQQLQHHPHQQQQQQQNHHQQQHFHTQQSDNISSSGRAVNNSFSGYSTVNVSAVCEDHEDTITNYCATIECLKPLCPDCIDAHYKVHYNQQTMPQIESIKNMRVNCAKKIDTAIQSLNKEITDCEDKYIQNPEQIIQTGVAQIQSAREKVMAMVHRFFEEQEQIFIRTASESILRVDDFRPTFERIQTLVQELERQRYALSDASQVLPSISRICRLDLISLRDKFKSDIAKVVQSRDLEPIQVVIDESHMHQLKTDLESILTLQRFSQQQNQVQQQQQHHNQQQQQIQPSNNNNNAINEHYLQSRRKSLSQLQQQLLTSPNTNSNMYETITNQAGGLSGSISGSGLKQAKKIFPNIPTPQKGSRAASPRRMSGSNNSFQFVPETFEVVQFDYFEDSCAKKGLHYFCPLLNTESSSMMVFVDLVSKHAEETVLETKIPDFHKSICLPSGDVYLMGGTNADQSKSNSIYKFNYNEGILEKEQDAMKEPRSSFGVCFLRNCIYVIGGITTGNKYLASCERFNLKTRKWEAVSPLNQPSASFCCSSFNNRFIFKIGGNQPDKNAQRVIEKYDVMMNKWHMINATVFPGSVMPIFASNPACVQINSSEVFVFGGYDLKGEHMSTSFVLRVDTQRESNQSGTTTTGMKEENYVYTIGKVNMMPLPIAEGFQNPQTVVLNNRLFVFQDITIESEDVEREKRTILEFTGKEWVVIGEA